MDIETATGSSNRGVRVGPHHRYGVYGIVVASDTPLALPKHSHDGLGQVEVLHAPASAFRSARQDADFDPRSDSWHQYASLPDGATYVRWGAVGEFLVAADGFRITCRREEKASLESFQVYLLGQALSHALVQQHFEPLHATVVVVDNQAVVFLGNSAFGKSTLAACFLEAGHRLLTDDLLILQESADGVLAYPGPPRLKLFPTIASRFLGYPVHGVPMNAGTGKLILPLDAQRSCARPVVLRAIYALAVPRETCRLADVRIESLSARDAFVTLVKSTFNRWLVSPQRLQRQFDAMASLADLIRVKKLSYPRALDRLPDVRAMVLADLAREARGVGSAPKLESRILDRGERWPLPSPTA